MSVMRLLLVASVLAVSACGSVQQPCPPMAGGDVVYVIGQGWHTGLGIPVEELNHRDFYRGIFEPARVIVFGYGKKTFFTAPPDTISEYFLGPFPGPAVIQVVGLSVTPVEAYSSDNIITLNLSPEQAGALSDAIWRDLTKDAAGQPVMIARSTDPDGLFYAADSEYNLLHTCNTWAVDALRKAGLPLSGDGVIFSHQAMSRVEKVAEERCGLVR